MKNIKIEPRINAINIFIFFLSKESNKVSKRLLNKTDEKWNKDEKILKNRNLLKFLLEIDNIQSIKNEIAMDCLIGPIPTTTIK